MASDEQAVSENIAAEKENFKKRYAQMLNNDTLLDFMLFEEDGETDDDIAVFGGIYFLIETGRLKAEDLSKVHIRLGAGKGSTGSALKKLTRQLKILLTEMLPTLIGEDANKFSQEINVFFGKSYADASGMIDAYAVLKEKLASDNKIILPSVKLGLPDNEKAMSADELEMLANDYVFDMPKDKAGDIFITGNPLVLFYIYLHSGEGEKYAGYFDNKNLDGYISINKVWMSRMIANNPTLLAMVKGKCPDIGFPEIKQSAKMKFDGTRKASPEVAEAVYKAVDKFFADTNVLVTESFPLLNSRSKEQSIGALTPGNSPDLVSLMKALADSPDHIETHARAIIEQNQQQVKDKWQQMLCMGAPHWVEGEDLVRVKEKAVQSIKAVLTSEPTEKQNAAIGAIQNATTIAKILSIIKPPKPRRGGDAPVSPFGSENAEQLINTLRHGKVVGEIIRRLSGYTNNENRKLIQGLISEIKQAQTMDDVKKVFDFKDNPAKFYMLAGETAGDTKQRDDVVKTLENFFKKIPAGDLESGIIPDVTSEVETIAEIVSALEGLISDDNRVTIKQMIAEVKQSLTVRDVQKVFDFETKPKRFEALGESEAAKQLKGRIVYLAEEVMADKPLVTEMKNIIAECNDPVLLDDIKAKLESCTNLSTFFNENGAHFEDKENLVGAISACLERHLGERAILRPLGIFSASLKGMRYQFPMADNFALVVRIERMLGGNLPVMMQLMKKQVHAKLVGGDEHTVRPAEEAEEGGFGFDDSLIQRIGKGMPNRPGAVLHEAAIARYCQSMVYKYYAGLFPDLVEKNELRDPKTISPVGDMLLFMCEHINESDISLDEKGKRVAMLHGQLALFAELIEENNLSDDDEALFGMSSPYVTKLDAAIGSLTVDTEGLAKLKAAFTNAQLIVTQKMIEHEEAKSPPQRTHESLSSYSRMAGSMGVPASSPPPSLGIDDQAELAGVLAEDDDVDTRPILERQQEVGLSDGEAATGADTGDQPPLADRLAALNKLVNGPPPSPSADAYYDKLNESNQRSLDAAAADGPDADDKGADAGPEKFRP